MFEFGKKLLPPLVDPNVPAAVPPAPEVHAHAPIESAAMDFIRDQVLLRIEPAIAVKLTQTALTARVDVVITQIAREQRQLLNQAEQHQLAAEIVDDMIGLGPIEPLLKDDSIADILINGPLKIYVERQGKLELTKRRFRNDAHVLHVAQRIASSVGRRVDESTTRLFF